MGWESPLCCMVLTQTNGFIVSASLFNHESSPSGTNALGTPHATFIIDSSSEFKVWDPRVKHPISQVTNIQSHVLGFLQWTRRLVFPSSLSGLMSTVLESLLANSQRFNGSLFAIPKECSLQRVFDCQSKCPCPPKTQKVATSYTSWQGQTRFTQ